MANMTTTRPKALRWGASLTTAAKAAVPAAAAGAGALAGTLAARWAAAKAWPEKYAAEGSFLPVAAGAAGAVVGGVAPLALMSMSDRRTKSGLEKTYKATYPIGALGILAVLLLTVVGPKAWTWIKGRWPGASTAATTGNAAVTAALASSGAPAAQLPAGSGAVVPNPLGTTAERQAALVLQRKAAGLSPEQWQRLQERSRGLSPDAWERLEQRRQRAAGGGSSAADSPRWAV